MLTSVRRYVTLLMLVALAIPVLAACGGQQTPQPVQKVAPTEAPAAEEPTEAPATDEPAEEPTEAPAADEPAEASSVEAVELPEVVPADVTGDIISAGSSTVYPLSERLAELFADEGYAGRITVDSIGSGAGFERFCVAAETDISNASRPIKDAEVASCQENGRDPIQFRVGTDAIAVTVSADNDFVDNLTMEELAMVFSTDATMWSDVNPDWPEEEIQIFAPGTDSGTFDFFVEVVLEEDETKILETNPQLSEDDNVLVQGIQGSPYAIGFFGYAYYQENEDTLKALSIDSIEPTEETAEDNSYPLSRPLFIYSAASIIQEKPQVAAFINYYLTTVNDEIVDVGYFPASEKALNESRMKLLEAME